MNARAQLRSATSAAHDRLDRHFASFDLGTREPYAQFLLAHAAAFIPVEQALQNAGAEQLIDGWAAHRRSSLLARDLADLGLPVPPPNDPPEYAGDAQIVGGAYVLEGSRLGAAVLARQVGAGLPRAFLTAVQEPGRWRRFLADLERILKSDVDRAGAELAAIKTFECFEQGLGVKMSVS